MKGKPQMSTTIEIELLEVFRREVKDLAQSSVKYNSVEPADVDAIVRAFGLAIDQNSDGATAQRLLEAINQR